ncbi:MAG TPA: hypothetical protein VFU23_04175 [Gemmatimonadales bacterium]|nr:hypothetical protein [Gemmatimonadales bacterium]
MVRSLVRRLLAATMLLVVALGGGGMPALDALVFHGPSRVAESFQSHYEASSGCHNDGCSIRSDAAPRILADPAPDAPPVIALRWSDPAHTGASVPGSAITLRYLSRAPPSVT